MNNNWKKFYHEYTALENAVSDDFNLYLKKTIHDGLSSVQTICLLAQLVADLSYIVLNDNSADEVFESRIRLEIARRVLDDQLEQRILEEQS